MRKFLSYRNIAYFLFIATFFIFVLAQRYTHEKGPKTGQGMVLMGLPMQPVTINDTQTAGSVPAVIIAQ